jgi:hypothetical protein
MDDIIDIPRDKIAFLETHTNVKSLWMLSIQMSAIKAFCSSSDKIKIERDKIPDELLRILDEKQFTLPSAIFMHLIRNESISKIKQYINNTLTYLGYLYREIKAAIYIFIDRTDQAFKSANFYTSEMWVAIQTGLIESSFDLMEKNDNILIYCSIRKEAYNNYKTDRLGNIEGQTCILNYDDDELHELINTLSKYYEKGDTIEQIVGFEKFEHPKTGNEESLFGYMLRHTVSRPRGLVRISRELKNGIPKIKTKEEKVEILRLITNMAASRIAEELFLEQELFLSCLKDKNERERFLALIPKNTLNQKSVTAICRKFNNKIGKCTEKQCNDKNRCKHPFCDLYNIGLFGYVSIDAPYKQIFKAPDSTNRIDHIPNQYSNYIIHPALCDIIKDLTQNYEGNNYIITPGITTGKNQSWGVRETEISNFIDFVLEQRMSKERRKEIIQRAKDKIKGMKETTILNDYIENEKQKILSFSKPQPKQADGIHVLIASPSDLQTRTVLLNEFQSFFTDKMEKECGRRIFVHGYEELASALVKNNVQDKVNDKIIKPKIDIVIAIFKHKLGSPIPDKKGRLRAKSGTVEELLNYKKNKTFPMAYFCNESPPTEKLSDKNVVDDWQKVLSFKSQLETKKNGNVIFFKYYKKDEKDHLFPLLAEDLKNNIKELFK